MSKYTKNQLSDMAKHMRGRNLSVYYSEVVIRLAQRFNMHPSEVAIKIDDYIIE